MAELFEDGGVVLSLADIKSFVPSPPNLQKAVRSMIDSAFKAKKMKQFMDAPMLSNVQDHPEIAADVIQAINDKNSPLRDVLLKDNPDVSVKQLVEYVERMARDYEEARNRKTSWLVLPIIGAVIALVAFSIYYFINRSQ
eukprot:TRINITY_DN7857_c0_g2_i3.p1 TRINITY_DN7857_c0_g2~~TRINITY_DN7857_c0_g2_i3.p1  ORF type:complete len:140 (-),score=49.15 TRINITY_DN7857_c0_g2_i3:133-552(-)